MITPHRLLWTTGIIGLMTAAGCRQDAPPEGARSEPSPYVYRAAGHEGVKSSGDSASSVKVTDAAPALGPAGTTDRGAGKTKAQTGTQHQGPGQDLHWPDPDAIGLTVPQGGKTEAFASPLSPMAKASVSVDPPNRRDPAQSAPTPPIAGRAASVEGDNLSSRIGQRARDYPADLAAQLDDQLLKLLGDERVPDLKSLGRLAAADRELLGALMDALSNFRSRLAADGNMLFSRKVRPLAELSERLRSQAELSVPTVALCTEVKGYGRYTPIEPARFTAGSPHQAVLYYEVENFLARLNDQKLYETRLSQDVVLYDESSGLEVWRAKKGECVDSARARRHDFFIRCLITLPPNLSTGRFLLKVTVQDQQARHVAENTLPIEIVAQ